MAIVPDVLVSKFNLQRISNKQAATFMNDFL